MVDLPVRKLLETRKVKNLLRQQFLKRHLIFQPRYFLELTVGRNGITNTSRHPGAKIYFRLAPPKHLEDFSNSLTSMWHDPSGRWRTKLFTIFCPYS